MSKDDFDKIRRNFKIPSSYIEDYWSEVYTTPRISEMILAEGVRIGIIPPCDVTIYPLNKACLGITLQSHNCHDFLTLALSYDAKRQFTAGYLGYTSYRATQKTSLYGLVEDITTAASMALHPMLIPMLCLRRWVNILQISASVIRTDVRQIIDQQKEVTGPSQAQTPALQVLEADAGALRLAVLEQREGEFERQTQKLLRTVSMLTGAIYPFVLSLSESNLDTLERLIPYLPLDDQHRSLTAEIRGILSGYANKTKAFGTMIERYQKKHDIELQQVSIPV
jgi:hypothetical protein